MENAAKIKVFVDLEFLREIFKFENIQNFGKRGIMVRSFIEFLEQKHVEIYFADNGIKIEKYNLFRVFLASDFENHFESGLKSSADYKYNHDFDFNQIREPFVFFFFNNTDIVDRLTKKHGILFNNSKSFFKNWRKLSQRKIIHIKESKQKETIDKFWNKLFDEIICNNQFFCIIEPYIGTWQTKTIDYNLKPIIDNLTESQRKCNSLIIGEVGYDYRQRPPCKIKNIGQLENVVKSFPTLNYYIGLIDRNNANFAEKTKIKNYLHDRYIYTNYYIINSAHSLNYIRCKNGKKQMEKNTQITISSIIYPDTFSFMISKFKNYQELTKLPDKLLETKKNTDYMEMFNEINELI